MGQSLEVEKYSPSVSWLNTSYLMNRIRNRPGPPRGSFLALCHRLRTSTSIAGVKSRQYSYVDLAKWLSLLTGVVSTDRNTGYQHQPCIDRTDAISQPILFDCRLYPMPVLQHHSRSFEECCLEEAREIADSGKPILLLWSGGIDSTCMLVALLRVLPSPDQLTVALNDFSIQEHPKFYADHLKDKIRCISSDAYYDTVSSPEYLNHVVVNGDPGGAVDGGGAMRQAVSMGADLVSPEWKSELKKVYRRIFNVTAFDGVIPEQELFDYFVDSMEVTAKNRGVEIRSLFDCLWWYIFNFKWQSMSLNMHRTCDQLFAQQDRSLPEWRKTFVSFFASDRFQLWSYSNREELLRLRLETPWPQHYKLAFKKMIFDYDGDQKYFDTKAKDAYLNRMIQTRALVMFALSSDLKPIYLR